MSLGTILAGLGVAGKAILAGLLFLVGAALAALTFGYQAVASALSFLAATWIIQTFVVAWVAFQLQEISLSNARRRDRLQAAYDRKVEATKALYGLIERRLYASRRYLGVIEDEPNKINDEREHYRTAVSEWNETSQIHQVTVLLDFHSYFGLLLDNTYNPHFLRIDNMLRGQRLLVENGKRPDTTTSKNIRETLHKLNRVSLDVVREMLKEARRDRNIVDEKVDISEGNLPHLSYGRLFKALLEPSA